MARRGYARDEIDDLSDEECRELLTALLEEVPGTVDSVRRRLARDRYHDDSIVGPHHEADTTDRRRARDRRVEEDRRYGRDWRSSRDEGDPDYDPESELPPSEQRQRRQEIDAYNRALRRKADDAHHKIEADLAREAAQSDQSVAGYSSSHDPQVRQVIDARRKRARDRANDEHHRIEQDYRKHHRGAADAAPAPSFGERFPETTRVGFNNLF